MRGDKLGGCRMGLEPVNQERSVPVVRRFIGVGTHATSGNGPAAADGGG